MSRGVPGIVERPTPVELLDDEQLAASDVVANSAMNRERGLVGTNSYARELGLDPYLAVNPEAASSNGATRSWLDLCCGTSRALIEAADKAARSGFADRLSIVGVDLVDFDPPSRAGRLLTLECASVSSWAPPPAVTFDLITCVHGLHYVGDKLALLARAASWLTPDGLFVANFDFAAVRDPEGRPWRRALLRCLRHAGFECDLRRHRVTMHGRHVVELPYRYLGADDRAGANYTGQPAVVSYYSRP